MSTKYDNPMYNKGYDDGFSDGAGYSIFYENIDWELFKKQKQSLVNLSCLSNITKAEKEAIEGILNLMDALQDMYDIRDI